MSNYLERDNERADNHSPSNKLPRNVQFTWAKGDLEQQDYQNIVELYKQDEIASCLALFKLISGEEIICQIVEFTNLYGKKEKHYSTFKLSDKNFWLFLVILLLSGYHKLPEQQMYWKTTPERFVSGVSNAISRNDLKKILQYLHKCEDL